MAENDPAQLTDFERISDLAEAAFEKTELEPRIYNIAKADGGGRVSERKATVSGDTNRGVTLVERTTYPNPEDDDPEVVSTLSLQAWQLSSVNPVAASDYAAWHEEPSWYITLTPDLDPATSQVVIELMEGTVNQDDPRFERYKVGN